MAGSEQFLNCGYGPLRKAKSIGMGKLAEGPRPLLEAYAKVARKHGMRPSLVGDRSPSRWMGDRFEDEAEHLHVLLFDDSWCIASRFTCERLDDAR